MKLVIDVGNSRIKAAVFEHDTILKQFVFEKLDFKNYIKTILNQYQNVSQMVVSSVGKEDFDSFSEFKSQLNLFFIDREINFPFKNRYKTPQTLGIDRLVLSAGAVLSFPNKNRLVIDAGTCVTYDYVNEKNEYLGGAISPGIAIRYKSLNDYTAKLPLLALKNPDFKIGDCTENAIHSGVVAGLCHEIDGFITDFKTNNQNFIIILTGGDALFLANRLKNTIFANSNFLLESLNQIHIYNNKND
jgi:type III pantothenate kinase